MIDTVPKNDQLTEVIEPLPVKPQLVLLTHMGDGTLRLTGQVRVRRSSFDPTVLKLQFRDSVPGSSRIVKVICQWADRAGHTGSYANVLSTNDGMAASALNDGNFPTYSVVQTRAGSPASCYRTL